MKTKTLLLASLFLCWLASLPTIAAALGTAFTYQGRLSSDGRPVAGNFDLRFTLYDAESEGSLIGTPVTTFNEPVVEGVFSLILDFGAGSFNGEARWLQVELRPAGTEDFAPLTPRQPLTAAPYAQFAASGNPGPQGPKGDTGDAGATGLQGPKGDDGAQGLPGPAGTQGPPGPAGSDGATGGAGAQGPQGPEGVNWRGVWDAGAAYATDDAISHNGSSWMAKLENIGSAPADGSADWDLLAKQGDTGATGTAGAQGPSGPAGVTGATGAQGPAGPTGAQGPQGVAGATGPQGPTGANGKTVLNGTVNPISEVGTTGDFYLNSTSSALFGPKTAGGWPSGVALVGPQGVQGSTGATGPQGAQGLAGATGPQGPAGASGATGPQGVAGPQGPVGPQGPSGAFTLNGTTASFVGGNVGIGTTTPRAKLHVEGGDLLAGAPGQEWIFHTRSHAGSDFLHITDSVDGAHQFQHGLTLNKAGNVGIGPTSGAYKLEVVGATRVSGELSVWNSLGNKVIYASPNKVFVYQGASVYGQLLVLGDGSTPGELNVQGHAYKTQGGTAWETLSDRRLKQDIRPYELGLNEVLGLRPVCFRYRDEPALGLTSTEERVGFIAQEVREVIPDAVTEGKDGYLSLSADPIHWAAINAIQQLNTKVEAQRADSEAKDAHISALERSVAELKELVGTLTQTRGSAL